MPATRHLRPEPSCIVAWCNHDESAASLAEPRHFALWEQGLFVALAGASSTDSGGASGRSSETFCNRREIGFYLFPIGNGCGLCLEVLLQAR